MAAQIQQGAAAGSVVVMEKVSSPILD